MEWNRFDAWTRRLGRGGLPQDARSVESNRHAGRLDQGDADGPGPLCLGASDSDIPVGCIGDEAAAVCAPAPIGGRWSPTAAAPRLTQRETEIARLVARGLRNREIAELLVLSERTVHAHLRSVLGKLRMRSRTEVAAWAAAAGMGGATPDRSGMSEPRRAFGVTPGQRG
jgi:DNA-binding CsgD family transcriptional regulator